MTLKMKNGVLLIIVGNTRLLNLVIYYISSILALLFLNADGLKILKNHTASREYKLFFSFEHALWVKLPTTTSDHLDMGDNISSDNRKASS